MRAGIGLIGRDDELAELERFLAGSGRGAVAVCGDAGVGKTALADELLNHAEQHGWRVLRVTAVEAEQSFALSGLNQMVFGLRDELAALASPDRDVLAPVLGADSTQSPSPMALTMALLALLTVAGRERPVLLVVEDAHWLDELSATVLGAAGRRVSDPRLRIVATLRSQPGAEAIVAGWAEIRLHPLSGADAERIVDRMSLSINTATRRAILELAEGNPLALEELPRYAGRIDPSAASMPLTDRLVAVFGSRLRQLDARVRSELLRAALDGARTNTSADSGSRYVMVDVDAALGQDLLVVGPSGDVVFRHPLVRAAVIHQAGAAERRAAHAHLAGLYDDVLVRRANHLSAAATGPDQSVADLLAQAARQSIRRGGAAVAVDWLRRAAELSTDPSRREALRADAAFVASQAGLFEDAQRLTEVDAESAATVLTNAYLALYRDGEVADSHRRVLAVLAGAEALDDEMVARLVKALLAITLYSGEEHLWRQTDEAVDRLADRLDTDALLYRDAWGDVVRRGQTVRTRLAQRRDELTTAEPWDVMRLGVTAYYVDGLADLRATLTRLYQRERDRGAVTNAMTMLHLLLLDQIRSGAWGEAAESVRIGLSLTASHHNDLFRYQFVAYDGLRAACAGDVDTARRCASEVTAWAGPRRLGLVLEFADRIAVLSAFAEGDYEGAYATALRTGTFRPYSHQSTDSLLDLVEAAVHTGHRDAAAGHLAEAARLRLADISPRLDALVAACQAILAPDADAGALFESALSRECLTGFPFEHNRIRLAYGMWLRRQRQTTEAREALTLAADGFGALGAQPWEARARNELRAAGAAVKRAAEPDVALSAQERTIAELAAAGRTNKQIAEQLYLSPRTVGAHLYRIFPKLGVSTRAGLGQALKGLDGET
ncbi:DNA-binding CsgD family transcriptional regulator [Mycobacterium sp. MAA66]|uniref:AAA family ATPase n=1 Tax=Mycobacterium sp. MAA66 TaxID=3156297 RepID=UPI0035196212